MPVTVGVQEESSVNGPEELNLLHPVCHYPWSTHPADCFQPCRDRVRICLHITRRLKVKTVLICGDETIEA